MPRLLAALCLLSAAACGHVQAKPSAAWDSLTDEQVARLAIRDALGELHHVEEVDAETGLVVRGAPAFFGRDDRLAFEDRVHAVLQQRSYGAAPTMELLRRRCQALQRSAFRAWPGDSLKRYLACDSTDEGVTLHTLYKRPLLQRALVEAMLEVVADEAFAAQTRARLDEVQQATPEPYRFVLGAWDQVEGFRPKG